IIPSIDIMGGDTVQLVGGKDHALSAGHPQPIAEKFGMVGDVAVIDLDAALGQGSNAALIAPLLRTTRCRVGGGIRDIGKATEWLNKGAHKIILGTAARLDLLSQLPKHRTIAALDALNGEIVVKGWREGTGQKVPERMKELREMVGGFLVTFVEREGRMQGIDLAAVKELVEAAGPARVTIAGGVTTAKDVADLDALGADAQVGMALYTGKLGLAEAFCAPFKSDRADGLWPTVVVDDLGQALGLVYSNLESIRAALAEKRGIYFSRQHGLWRKGESSGAVQELVGIDVDCDRDALRFVVRQLGAGFCHVGTRSCWGDDFSLQALLRTLSEKILAGGAASYTSKLAADEAMLASKLTEEAAELAQAAADNDVVHEMSDLIYFACVKLAKHNIDLSRVMKELEMRHRQVVHRHGQVKE
ncbi:MAG: phosphoribosyl-ATP diphosphatase, partial [Alphaproteobacteria bacterium]|nr:phosphoribosyl-ATP diphosphatase [Alphaproteobacteria bacterium]